MSKEQALHHVSPVDENKAEKDTILIRTTRPIIPPYKDHPVLETSKPEVFLRPFRADDLDALHELRSQIEVMKWTSTSKVDVDRNATHTWMRRFMAIEDELQHTPEAKVQAQIEKSSSKPPGGFNFVVVHRARTAEGCRVSAADEKVIGAAGIHRVAPEPECGYMIRTEYWKQGIATSVVRSLLDAWWKLDRVDVQIERPAGETKPLAEDSSENRLEDHRGVTFEREALHAEIDADNIASQRVLQKCGFRYDYTRVDDSDGVTLKHFRLFRPLR